MLYHKYIKISIAFEKRCANFDLSNCLRKVTAIADAVWASRFGAEFFVFEREAYLHTSSEENGKNKQKYNPLEENRRFSTIKNRISTSITSVENI